MFIAKRNQKLKQFKIDNVQFTIKEKKFGGPNFFVLKVLKLFKLKNCVVLMETTTGF